MPFEQLAHDVLNPGLCAGCGLCAAVCPEFLLTFDGAKARIVDEAEAKRCGNCVLCHTICPGADPETERLEQNLFGRRRFHEERWLGICRNIYGGYANDPTIFKRSASGGLITALLLAAKDYLNLDAILAVGRETARPGYATGRLCRDRMELLDTCQSTYQLFPYLNFLGGLLNDEVERRIAVIGLACHVQAIRKLQSLPSELGRRARSRLTFLVEAACSSNTPPIGTDSLLRQEAGITLDEVNYLRYRDGQYPGSIHAISCEGQKITIPFWKAVRELKHHKTHRCLSCGDWFSGLSDLAVCDGDPNIFATSQARGNKQKNGKLLVRTALGEEIVGWAADSGYVTVWPSQMSGPNLGLDRKRHRRTRYEQTDLPIPAGPISGYVEEVDIIDDDKLIPDEPTSG